MRRITPLLSLLLMLGLAAAVLAQDKSEPVKKGDKNALTLEKLFPKKGLFGTSARSAEFSHDGRYAAYLYQPYPERRHGPDLYIYDFNSGKTERITSVSVLAEFQQSTREVQEDRLKKARAEVASRRRKYPPKRASPRRRPRRRTKMKD